MDTRIVAWRLGARLLGAALALLALTIMPPSYATAEPGVAQLAPAQTPALRPALIVVPADDGQSVLVQAGGLGEIGGQLFTNLLFGPSGNKGSYTMAYSDTLESYVTSVPGFAAAQSVSAGLSITTTGGLDSGELVFTRVPVPAGATGELLATDDGGLALSIINPDTFSAGTYLAAAPSYAPPGPAPAGLRLAGRSYSLRASGALALTEQPMSLRLFYDPAALTPDELASLAIYAWDAAGRRWDAAGSTVWADEAYASAPITRFTFYALMTAAPAETRERLFLPFVLR
ncbi:MAG: hypothetical protein HGA45_37205 [Chloroflexales bacterium]|nr:hypothetical protein [Chloroflexales bacterium]